jgi:hypothetical protein
MLQQVGKLFNSFCYHIIIYRAGSLTTMLAESYEGDWDVGGDALIAQPGIQQVQALAPGVGVNVFG